MFQDVDELDALLLRGRIPSRKPTLVEVTNDLVEGRLFFLAFVKTPHVGIFGFQLGLGCVQANRLIQMHPFECVGGEVHAFEQRIQFILTFVLHLQLRNQEFQKPVQFLPRQIFKRDQAGDLRVEFHELLGLYLQVDLVLFPLHQIEAVRRLIQHGLEQLTVDVVEVKFVESLDVVGVVDRDRVHRLFQVMEHIHIRRLTE